MMLSIIGISKSYGSRRALKSIDLSCSKGQICGLIGPNGAGKSTLFRIILGLVRPDAGEISINSDSRKAVGGIIDRPALYGYLSAYNNLRVFGSIQGIEIDEDMYSDLMRQVGLDEKRSDPVKNYSTGMKQRLGLAIALIDKPDLILLDEPFAGLDPIGIRSLHQLIRKLTKEEGITAVISSHNLWELGELCDFLYVMNNGEITAAGPTATLLHKAASSFLIYGNNLETSSVLEELGAEFRSGYAVVSPGTNGIELVISQLIKEGCAITACIPQTELRSLYDVRKS